jgi:enoyl-CoA hydratase/carnithine racemase
MQQAYRVLRVVAEAETIRMELLLNPNQLMLQELVTACTALKTEGSSGVKAVVLDFKAVTDPAHREDETISFKDINWACAAVQDVEPPVLAVVRSVLSEAGSALIQASDLILVADEAVFSVPGAEDQTYTGAEALRLGYATWSVPARNIDAEMERILDMLRSKSAIALRYVKASVRLGTPQSTKGQEENTTTRLAALKQINEFYLGRVMQTADATEGLQAFLDKRKPQWKNR